MEVAIGKVGGKGDDGEEWKETIEDNEWMIKRGKTLLGR